jgi:hypothetical protein
VLMILNKNSNVLTKHLQILTFIKLKHNQSDKLNKISLAFGNMSINFSFYQLIVSKKHSVINSFSSGQQVFPSWALKIEIHFIEYHALSKADSLAVS